MSITPIGNEGAWGIGQQTVQRHHPSFTNTASLLGLSSTDLTSHLQPGTTLAELAQRKGVSSSDLLASVEKDRQANAPQGAAAPSDSQLQQFATNIINGTRPSEAGKRAHSNLSSPARTSQLLGSSKAGYGSPLTGSIDGGVARRVRVSSSPSRLDRVSIRAE
jgi:hypothetical protein